MLFCQNLIIFFLNHINKNAESVLVFSSSNLRFICVQKQYFLSKISLVFSSPNPNPNPK